MLRRLLKLVSFGFFVVILLAIAAAVAAVLALDRIVKVGIEKGGPLILQVPVTVDSVSVSLWRGSFAVEGLTVGNPPGFSSRHAISLGRIQVDADLRSLLSDEVVMPLIEIRRPEMILEFVRGETNIGTLLANVKEPPEREPSRKRLSIDLVRVTEASVAVGGLPGGEDVSFPLPDMEMRDLKAGGEPGTARETIALLLARIYRRILSRGAGVLPGVQVEALDRELEGLLERGVEELDRRLEEQTEGLRQKLEEETGELKERLDELLK